MTSTEKEYVESFDRLKTKIVASIVKDIRMVAKLYNTAPPNRLSDITGQVSFLHAAFHDIVSNSFTTSLRGMSNFGDKKTMNDLLKGEACGKTDDSGGRLDSCIDS